MRILVVCQYYDPEPFRLSDICEGLVSRGYEVMVITGLPNYPMGEIYKEYRHGKRRDEVINGVKVHRCFTIGRRHYVLFRLLNYFSYQASSTHYVKSMQEQFDVVFVNQQSPVTMANAGIKYKEKSGKKLALYCMDLWPESIVFGGIKRNSLRFALVKKLSQRIYKSADIILGTSKSFADYFREEFNIGNTEYLPQYAELIFDPERCKKEPDGQVDLMFAGNVGVAQSVNTIIDAARLTKCMENLHWHIVGDGIEIDNLKNQAKDLSNITFYGRKPLEEMPKYYAMTDAMLVTMQSNPVISMTVPGKVQSYMSAGKPILGAINGETSRVINEAKCGYCCHAEDAEGLATIAQSFVGSSEKEQMAHNAFVYYQHHFSKDRFIENLEAQLSALL